MTRVTELPFTGASTNTSYNPGFLVVENQLTRRLPWNSLVDYFRRNVYGADQSLATTSTVDFRAIDATTASFSYVDVDNWLSIGASLGPGDAPPAPFYISNELGSARVTTIMRAYKDNFSNPGSLNNFPSIIGEFSRGTSSSPLAVNANDTLFVLSATGYDGERLGTSRGVSGGLLAFFAEEDWKGNLAFNVNTASGTSFLFRTQPLGTRSGPDNSHMQITMAQTWAMDETHNIPGATMFFGSGLLGEGYSTIMRADGTTYNSPGSARIYFQNSKVLLMGVPRENVVGLDNPTLNDTNVLQFVGNRRNGARDRRDVIAKGDTLGRIEFRGQHISSATSGGIGLVGGEISYKALETFQVGTGSGTKIVLTSINSGTNTESTRLELLNKEHTHFSDRHSFRAADGTLLAQLTTASFAVFVTSTIQASGLSLRQTFTATTSLMSTGTFTTIDLVGYKSYMIQKIETNLPARVRFYTDSSSRNTDRFRSEATSASAYNGVIADIVTTSTGLSRTTSPGIFGFNNDTSTNSTVYMTVNNKHTTTATITVSVTVLQLES